MTSRSKKFEIAIFIALSVVLAVVWAMNGFKDTWLYVTSLIIAIPISWYYWDKEGKDK